MEMAPPRRRLLLLPTFLFLPAIDGGGFVVSNFAPGGSCSRARSISTISIRPRQAEPLTARQLGRRVLITPPPKEVGDDCLDPSDSRKSSEIEGGATASRRPTGTPNWIFLYPRACVRLFSNTTAGASVRSANVFDIPPDSCQGGYYGNGELDPEQVLRDGLARRGDDWDLLNHVLQGGNSAFRGTTKQIVYPEDGVGAASFAGEGGHVYEVTCLPSWDVNRHLQGRVKSSEWAVGGDRFGGNAVLGEHEYAVASRVPPSHIKRYGGVVRSAGGTLFVPRAAWVENPAWNPAFCRYSVSDYSTCEAIRVMLREMDLDGNGALDLDEFLEAMEKNSWMQKATENARTLLHDDGVSFLDPETIFRRFDLDNSGSLSAEELRKFLLETENCSLV